jgi:DNA-binding HxlR family transcriptional regulator
MDEIKDMQRSDNLSKFIDGHAVRTNPFGGNRAAERLYGRCERIVAGVYLLTRHIPPNEPLKERTRSASLVLLDSALDLKNEMRSAESDAVSAFMRNVRTLISLARTLTAGGFVSFHNADVLIAALDELGTFVSASQRTSFSENVTLTKEDFIGHLTPAISIGHSIGLRDSRAMKDSQDVSDAQGHIETDRTQAVLQVLISGREMGIKDISGTLPEYSEKMVQRELAILVKDGKVRKTGSKRWSRYSLVSQGGGTAQQP